MTAHTEKNPKGLEDMRKKQAGTLEACCQGLVWEWEVAYPDRTGGTGTSRGRRYTHIQQMLCFIM